ncbi:MAG TPA: hypothetical protein ENN17_08055 [bacterium]|nr:hypothetical protein [bacterium]
MRTALCFLSTNDRAVVACVRSLVRRGVPVRLIPKRGAPPDPFRFTAYASRTDRKRPYADPSDPVRFHDSLLQIFKTYPESVILPTGEALIRGLFEEEALLRRFGVTLPVPDPDLYHRVSDKGSFVRWMAENDFPVPPRITRSPAIRDVPFVIKPEKGVLNGQKQFPPVLVLDRSDYRRRKALIGRPDVFFQKWLPGDSYYYCALYRRGERILYFTQRNLVQQPHGKSIIRAAPCRLPRSLCGRVDDIISETRWSGPLMMEFRLHENRYYAIEINPRLWGPLQLALDNGVDFPCALYRLSVDGMFDVPDPGTYVPSSGRGYLWISGYVQGMLLKTGPKGRFQRFRPAGKNTMPFRDVWFRPDTWVFGCLEGLFVLVKWILSRTRRTAPEKPGFHDV